MDVITLATTALMLAKPFFEKTGEGVARKIGEDIWNLIKSPFVKNKQLSEDSEKPSNLETFKESLIEELKTNEEFKNILQSNVNTFQKQLNEGFQQNINNNDKVEKQINIQSNSGNIQM